MTSRCLTDILRNSVYQITGRFSKRAIGPLLTYAVFHGLFYVVFPNEDSKNQERLGNWALFCVLSAEWVPTFLYELLDRKAPKWFREKYKCYSPLGEPSFAYMAWLDFRNTTSMMAIFLFALRTRQFIDFTEYSLLASICYALAAYCVYDFTFYVGHRLFHSSKSIFNACHRTHHTSHATSAASHAAMDWFDFVFEIPIPFFVASWAIGWKAHVMASFAVVGYMNAVIVHSGWDLPLLTDPKPHFVHHHRYAKNFSIGLCDALFSTHDAGDDVKYEGERKCKNAVSQESEGSEGESGQCVSAGDNEKLVRFQEKVE